jgi:transposase
MRKVREVLRLKWEQGRTNRDIGIACRIGATTVQECLRRASSAGLSWPLPENLTDETLEAALYPPPPPTSAGRPLPDLDYVTRELRRKGVTLFLLWEEYRARHPTGFGYSRFCELYGEHAAKLDPRMRQVHRAGEKLFVDYAGQTLEVVDRATGEIREVQVFVATLGASDFTYVEATWTQTLPDWIGSHVRVFEFLGGVPEIVVPDNLKSGVTSACYFEPDINPTYLDMARHYGVAIIPARPGKPRDKAKVENHVLNAERRILAPLRDRRFFSLDEVNTAIWERLELLNDRSFQQLQGTRRQLFREIDEPALRPLPVEPYSFAVWRKARVHVDYHVAVDHCFYSVPYTLLREEVDVRLSERVVEIFFKNQRVASHPRSARPNAHVTVAEHMPRAHRSYQEWTPERLVRWASQTGGATAAVVEQILSRRVHPQQGFRSCLGVMRLGKEYGTDRLEAACARALHIGSPTYKSISSILLNRLDGVATEPGPELTAAEWSGSGPPHRRAAAGHANIRGAAYYKQADPDTVATDVGANDDNRAAVPESPTSIER